MYLKSAEGKDRAWQPLDPAEGMAFVLSYVVMASAASPTSARSEEERRAAYRESGRAVAVALIGLTLQAVSVLPTYEESGAISTVGFVAFKERGSASLDELTFVSAGGVWGESLEFPDARNSDIESIVRRFERLRIDKGKLRTGLDYLTKNYRSAALEIAQRLLQQKIMNGIECGKIILAHRARI